MSSSANENTGMFRSVRNLTKQVFNQTRRMSLRGNNAPSHNYDYDLIVIGAGSGGVRAARISGGHGAKVALIEPSFKHGPPFYSAIGGTCVNVGCVPKKLFVYGSHYSEYLKDSPGFGWKFADAQTDNSKLGFDWDTLNENKNKEIDRLNEIYVNMLRNAGVDVIEGFGSFTDKNTVKILDSDNKDVELKQITGDKVLICTGGWPFKPSIPGADLAITSNEAFYLKEKPKSMVIVGGGYIGVEFANIMHGYGVDVTLVHRGNLFLRGFDQEIREHLRDQMEEAGVRMLFNAEVTGIQKQDDGSLKAMLSNGEEKIVSQVMFATGRKARIEDLNIDAAGVKTDPRGNVLVDDYSKTNVSNIYAVGDVTNRMQLTPVALYEGHCLADTLYGGKDRPVSGYDTIASAVFSNPEIGTVGYTEEEAIKKFKKVSVFTTKFTPLKERMTGKLYRKDFMKLIVDDDTDIVIGCHICGNAAAEITQGVAIAVKMRAKKADFDATIGIHPTGAEELVTMRTATRHYSNGVVAKGPRL